MAAPVVDNIAQAVSTKIRELNGDKTVSACFVVGGGGKIHGFTEKLAEDLDLPEERVALRGEDCLLYTSRIIFSATSEGIVLSSLSCTSWP